MKHVPDDVAHEIDHRRRRCRGDLWCNRVHSACSRLPGPAGRRSTSISAGLSQGADPHIVSRGGGHVRSRYEAAQAERWPIGGAGRGCAADRPSRWNRSLGQPGIRTIGGGKPGDRRPLGKQYRWARKAEILNRLRSRTTGPFPGRHRRHLSCKHTVADSVVQLWLRTQILTQSPSSSILH